MKSELGAFNSLRAVFSLSAGTLTVQVLSAVGQFALAYWLAPSEFGHWAAAISAMTVLTSLTNFGEVSGYLSGSNNSFKRARFNAFKANVLLVPLGLGISLLYFSAENNWVALYCLIIAFTIPIKGEADILTAANIHYKLFRQVVQAQFIAAILKFAVSVALAIIFQSAVALAVSNTLYSLVLIFMLRKPATTVTSKEDDTQASPIFLKQRFSWALNSYFMSFPVQAIFLGAQFVLSSSQLGLMYLGFQITIALSSLLAVPLNRVVLSVLSKTKPELRSNFTARLGSVISILVTAISALLALALSLSAELLPQNWVLAIPIAIAFLVSMPMRILTPILEARQQVEMKWTQATLFNIIESLGLIVVVLSFNWSEEVVWLALAISGWKISLGLMKSLFVLRGQKAAVLLAPPVSSLVGAALLLGGFISPIYFNSIFLIVVTIIIIASWFFWKVKRKVAH